MKRVLVTGGAGFIGRALVARLLELGHRVVVVDDYSNSSPESLDEVRGHAGLEAIVVGDLKDPVILKRVFDAPYDLVFHLAASIRVQDSIDDPRTTFDNDVTLTFNVLEACRQQYFAANGVEVGAPFHLDEVAPRLLDRRPRLVFTSTCMVYDRAFGAALIEESHPTRPASPYGASKIAAENLVLSYGHSYGLSVAVARPFNTYGPFQKSNLEGGVVSIFLANALAGRALNVKGDGTQTRDLLYVDDCARFLAMLGLSTAFEADGLVVNAATGVDVSIAALAGIIAGADVPVAFVAHDHPQAEIQKLCGSNAKAERLLGFVPEVNLADGLKRTRAFLASRV